MSKIKVMDENKNISNIKITNKKTMGNKHANKIYNLYTK